MEAFELNSNVSSKAFLVKLSKVEKRLDPLFYQSMIYKLINKSKFTITNLNNVILNLKSGVGAGKQDQATSNDGIIQIRPTNINREGHLIYDKCIYLPREKISQLELIDIDDILFNNTNSQELVGKTAILKKKIPLFFSNHITRITVDKGKIIPEYLWVLLNFYQQKKVFFSICTNWNNQSGVGNDLLRKLRIPLPSLDEQAEIVEHIEGAHLLNHQKQQQAQALLVSIDDYLLKELGITLPEQDNSLEKRIFLASSCEVSGQQYDPSYYFNKYFKIEGGYYKNVPLIKIASLTKGQSISSKQILDGSYPVIAGGQSSPYTHKYLNQLENVITISASGAYSGYVWYHDYPIFASDCTVVRSMNEEDILTKYIAEVLKLKQKEIYLLQKGAGQPHVYPNDLAKLNIPIPPLEKQQEIVNHIERIRNQAKQLQQEAEQVLIDAKVKVEKMILGEEA